MRMRSSTKLGPAEVVAEARAALGRERDAVLSLGARGPGGNARLTAISGAVLVVLLAIEGVTLLALRPMISVHVFVGVLLIPLVVLKLASVAYRFVRYYAGSAAYRASGAPHSLLRLLAPVVIVTTLAVLASGVLMIAVGPPARWLVTVHVASVIAWVVVVAIHVLAHSGRLLAAVPADVRRAGRRAAGARSRLALVSGAVLVGVAAALVATPYAAPWTPFIG